MSPAVTFRNIKRKRLDEDEENRLSTFMSDIKELFFEFKQHQEEKCGMLCSMVHQIRDTVDHMAAKFDELALRVESLETERRESLSYIGKLETKIEQFEQSSRSTCLEIRNIPVAKSETKTSLLNTVIDVSKLINRPIQPQEIKDVFRIRTKDPANKTIVVDFTTVLRKDDFLEKFRKHSKDSFRLTTEHLKISGPAKPVFISENLISRKKRLFFLSRDAAKSHNFKFCWVKHGKIFIREKEGSKHFEIQTETDLSTIFKSA